MGYASNGRLGVEAQANYYLINSNAPLSEKAALDLQNEKYPGDDVYTTLNVKLQQVAASALGVYDGAIIVTEPKTGKVLAMVSKPDFDPEQIENIWDDLINDDESSVLLNRATQGLYRPDLHLRSSLRWNIFGKTRILTRITAINAAAPLPGGRTGFSVIMDRFMDRWILPGLLPSPATRPLPI